MPRWPNRLVSVGGEGLCRPRSLKRYEAGEPQTGPDSDRTAMRKSNTLNVLVRMISNPKQFAREWKQTQQDLAKIQDELSVTKQKLVEARHCSGETDRRLVGDTVKQKRMSIQWEQMVAEFDGMGEIRSTPGNYQGTNGMAHGSCANHPSQGGAGFGLWVRLLRGRNGSWRLRRNLHQQRSAERPATC